MRKVYVNLQVRMILNMNEGVEVGEVIDEMDYNFKSQTTGADIIDTEIEGHEVTDSK